MKAIFETRYARIGEASAHYGTTRITSTECGKLWAAGLLGEYFDERADQEEMLVAILDTKLAAKRIVRVTRGTLDASIVHPREVFRPAIQDAASAILLVHQHPSGDPTPSKADLDVTRRIKEAGTILGIPLIDHIVVGCGTGRAVSILESYGI